MMDRSDCILKIRVPLKDNYEVIVRPGYKPKGESLSADNNGNYLVSEGKYDILFNADGYCSEERVIQIDGDDLGKEIIVDIEPVCLGKNKAEFKGVLFKFSEDLEKVLYDDIVAKKIVDHSYDTPAFDPQKGELVFTTTEECYAYLRKSEMISDRIQVFDIEGMVAVFVSKMLTEKFSDIHECLDAMKTSGKLNVFYQANIHGTEPASGEAALAFIGEAAKGRMDGYLDVMNILIMPRSNPYGADMFERECRGVDINRDALSLECHETVILHNLFRELMPHVTIDSHTFTRANALREDRLDRAILDIRVSPARSKNMDEEINKLSTDLAAKVIKYDKSIGIRAGYYGDSADPTTSRVYYGLFNTCSFLVESEGTRSGKSRLRRNIWCQLKTLKCLLDLLKENAEIIKSTVTHAREKCLYIEKRTEESEQRFVLKHGKSDKFFFKTKQPSYDYSGKIIDNDHVIYSPRHSVTKDKIVRPYAYIISKGNPNYKRAVDALRKHEIEIKEINEAVELTAAQYYISDDKVRVDDERKIVFSYGAFIVPVSQISSNLVCTLLEPGSCDAKNNNGSLVQQNIIRVNKENKFNIYRTMSSEHEKYYC